MAGRLERDRSEALARLAAIRREQEEILKAFPDLREATGTPLPGMAARLFAARTTRRFAAALPQRRDSQ